jgi:hypothetical protein
VRNLIGRDTSFRRSVFERIGGFRHDPTGLLRAGAISAGSAIASSAGDAFGTTRAVVSRA